MESNREVATPDTRPQLKKQPVKKGEHPGLKLREAIRNVVDVCLALRDIGVVFQQDERYSINLLRKHATRHAETLGAGGRPDINQLNRTIRLADRVHEALDDRFEAIMQDSFHFFDKEAAEVRKIAPEILERDGNKIAELQENLRRLIAKETTPYTDLVQAYKAMTGYFGGISPEIEDLVAKERENRRRANNQKIAADLLAEINALDEI